MVPFYSQRTNYLIELHRICHNKKWTYSSPNVWTAFIDPVSEGQFLSSDELLQLYLSATH